MSGPFIGQIMMFAGNFAPAGCALYDGSLLSIADNPQQFSAIGNAYGGDGKSTFALPDLRGCVPIGQGQGRDLSRYRIGECVGTEQVALTTAQLPQHGHRVSAVAAPGTAALPAGNTLISGGGGQAASGEFQTPAYAPAGNQTSLHAVTIGRAGGASPTATFSRTWRSISASRCRLLS